MKKVFICLIIIVIILLSFFLPNVLFRLEDIKINNTSYKMEKLNRKIDVQSENIYLVKAIHDIQDRRTQSNT